MKAVIFLGPSLPVHEAEEILDATYLPPARQTDFLTAAVNLRPDAIGLIDGVFLQSLSVWHKEILFALDQGILVYGASSMGALRAAETAEYGMIGVGEIYRQYASGELQDDDEVALAHASADQNYQKASEPMVNIRATLAAAEKAGIVDAAQRARMNAIAKAMYFADRTFAAIFEVAGAECVPPDLREKLASFIRTNYVDQKKQDAIELLRNIKQLESMERESWPEPKPFELNRSNLFGTLYTRDRRVQHGDVSLALESIANYVSLHEPCFDELNFNALNRIILFDFASVLGVKVSEDDIDKECARFRKKRGLVAEEDLALWLEANHLSRREFRDLLTQVAHCRGLHRWFMFALWMDRTTQTVLDELRLTGKYVDWVARAAAQERLLEGATSESDRTAAARIPLDELLAEHQRWTGRGIDIDTASWAEEAGYHTLSNLKMELSRSRAARGALLRLLVDSMPAEDGETQPQAAPAAGNGGWSPSNGNAV